MPEEITLTGSASSTLTGSVRVYQDHDGVKIDLGLYELMLDIDQAAQLAWAVTRALQLAIAYENAHREEEEEDADA